MKKPSNYLVPSEDLMILRLTTTHENRVILSEAKNLALLRNGPMSKARARSLASLSMTARFFPTFEAFP